MPKIEVRGKYQFKTEQAEELYNTIHKDFVVHWFDDYKAMKSRRMLCLYNVVTFEEVNEHEFDTRRPLTFIKTFSGDHYFAEISFPRFKLMHKKAFMTKVVGPKINEEPKDKGPDEDGPMFTFYQL